MIPNLDTFWLWEVNSKSKVRSILPYLYLTKGAHYMSMFSTTTILIFSPDVAGVLPFRSEPIDH